MTKIDYKKEYKDLYLPKSVPSLINVPEMRFIMIDGKGDPNGDEYREAVSMLYTISFTIKMNGKGSAGYFDYVVPPLEGLWWCEGKGFDFYKRDNWRWTSMIRQPEFVTQDVFEWAISAARQKKPGLNSSKTRFESFTEGLCVQIMHIGHTSTNRRRLKRCMSLSGRTNLSIKRVLSASIMRSIFPTQTKQVPKALKRFCGCLS